MLVSFPGVFRRELGNEAIVMFGLVAEHGGIISLPGLLPVKQ